jgi:hypothetical protein
MIDLVAQPLHDALQLDEVEDEPALLVQVAFDRDARAIVVAVQSFAAMPGERDEVRRGKDQIVFRHRNAEFPA